MIKAEDILNATHGGLDIILDCYPQAKGCVNTKKHFAIRDERTPSASLREYDSKSYGKIWQVTDFGGDVQGAIRIFKPNALCSITTTISTSISFCSYWAV